MYSLSMVIRARSAASQQAAQDRPPRRVPIMLTYSRYSKLTEDKAIAGGSLELQASRNDHLAQQYGATVVERFSDDKSAAFDRMRESKPKHRPGFADLLAAIERVRPDYLGSVWGDRLMRNMEEWLALLGVCVRAGTKLVSEDGITDPEQEADVLQGHFKVMLSEQYVATIRRNVRSKFADRRRQGLPGYGARVYGFHTDKVTPREDEAQVLRWMAAEVLKTPPTPLNQLAKRLNADGVPTPLDVRRAEHAEACDKPDCEHKLPAGTQWSTLTIKKLLRRAINAGWLEHKGELVKPLAVVESGEATPLFDLDTFERILDALDGRSAGYRDRRHSNRLGSNGHFLSGGPLRCGRPGCGAALKGGSREGLVASPDQRIRTYMCPNTHMSIDAEATENAVKALVLELRASPEHMHGVAEAAEGRTQEWRALHERYMDLGQRLDALAENLDLSERVLARRSAALEAERAKVKAAMDKLGDPTDTAKLHAKAADRVRREWDEAVKVGNWPVLRGYVTDVVAGFRVMPTQRGKRTPVADRLEVMPLT